MSLEEVKKAIIEFLNNSSEQVFDYQKAVQGKSDKSVSHSRNLRTILAEDKECWKD